MLTTVTVAKALVEFAGLLLLGQGLVFLLSFGRHESNPIYRFLRFLTGPVVRPVRVITPRFVVDQHVPAIALFILFWAWVALKFWQVVLAHEAGLL
ncbi:MAG: hypothetical protein EBT33_09685 [Betaproteobacteria bacterium]|nr:hypothetical protein [Betaproteobacteria bacterium]